MAVQLASKRESDCWSISIHHHTWVQHLRSWNQEASQKDRTAFACAEINKLSQFLMSPPWPQPLTHIGAAFPQDFLFMTDWPQYRKGCTGLDRGCRRTEMGAVASSTRQRPGHVQYTHRHYSGLHNSSFSSLHSQYALCRTGSLSA